MQFKHFFSQIVLIISCTIPEFNIIPCSACQVQQRVFTIRKNSGAENSSYETIQTMLLSGNAFDRSRTTSIPQKFNGRCTSSWPHYLKHLRIRQNIWVHNSSSIPYDRRQFQSMHAWFCLCSFRAESESSLQWHNFERMDQDEIRFVIELCIRGGFLKNSSIFTYLTVSTMSEKWVPREVGREMVGREEVFETVTYLW